MARLRWRIYFESLWDSELPTLVRTQMPHELKGQQRVDFAKAKRQAADLLRTLFPADEDTDEQTS